LTRYAHYLIFLAALLSSCTSFAQPALEAAATYSFSYANTTSPKEFWQNGGSVELHAQFLKGLGAVARLDGLHTSNMEGTGIGLDLLAATFGPRYTWAPRAGRLPFYGEALGGWSKGFNSEFPTQSGLVTTTDSAAFLLGGGVNYRVSERVAIRVFDAHWMRTYFPDATTGRQNTLVAGTGIVFTLR
jgi:opacity protein-like surface antigen